MGDPLPDISHLALPGHAAGLFRYQYDAFLPGHQAHLTRAPDDPPPKRAGSRIPCRP